MENSNFTIMENAGKLSFSWYDYILFTVMLVASGVIGIYFGCFGSKHQKSAAEYLMGSKKLKVLPISISLIASHASGVTLLALPADVYKYGASFWLFLPAIALVGVVTFYVFLPVFYKLQLTTTHEYLERRFDTRTRLLASFFFILSTLLYLPVVIYLPALAFSSATGINVHIITVVISGICIFYTTIGGAKAVIWTDTLQFAISVGSILTVFVLGLISAGGFGNVWQINSKGGRLDVFDFNPDLTKRDSFWITLPGLAWQWLYVVSIRQNCVQKFLSVSTIKEAKISLVCFILGLMAINAFSITTGMLIYARYAGCDPFARKIVRRNDELLPYYVMDVGSNLPGLPGLFIAGIFCAALSALSVGLNSVAGAIYEDFVKRLCIGKTTTPDGKRRRRGATTTTRWWAEPQAILKMIVVLFGTVCTAQILVVERLGGILPVTIAFLGAVAGPLMAMFFLGVLFPRATSRGAFYGSVIGIVFIFWIVIMAGYYQMHGVVLFEPKVTSVDGCHNNGTGLEDLVMTLRPKLLSMTTPSSEPKKIFILFRISYYLYCPLAFFVSLVCGLVISYFDSEKECPIHKDLLSPIVHRFLKNTAEDDVRYYGVREASNRTEIQ